MFGMMFVIGIEAVSKLIVTVVVVCAATVYVVYMVVKNWLGL